MASAAVTTNASAGGDNQRALELGDGRHDKQQHHDVNGPSRLQVGSSWQVLGRKRHEGHSRQRVFDQRPGRSAASARRGPVPTSRRPATTTAQMPPASAARQPAPATTRPTARRTMAPEAGVTRPSTQLAGSSAGSVSSQRRTAIRQSRASIGTANSVSHRELVGDARGQHQRALERDRGRASPTAVSTARRWRGERHRTDDEELEQRAVHRRARQPSRAGARERPRLARRLARRRRHQHARAHAATASNVSRRAHARRATSDITSAGIASAENGPPGPALPPESA